MYDHVKNWFDVCRLNTGKVRAIHSALYFYIIYTANSLRWPDEFGLPTKFACESLGVSSHHTLINALNELADFGVIEIVQRSINQYQATIIALAKNAKQLPSNCQATAKQLPDTCQATAKQMPHNKTIIHKDINTKRQKTKDIDSDKSESANGKLHQDFISVFTVWYENKIGMPYRFSGGHDGKAAKEIIGYIKKAQREKNGRDPHDSEVLNGWEFILNNYSKWDSFYQSQIKLSQINSNIPNIMANIKGISRKGNNLTASEQSNEISRLIAAMGN